MDLRFDGKTAVVTGGASGIGLAVATALASSGASVFVFDVAAAAQMDAARAGIAASGGSATACYADVTELAATTRAIADVASRAGGVDVIVNCAGITAPQELLGEGDAAMWRRIVEVNLFGTIHVCRAAIPHLVERGSGRIINIASDAGRVGSAGEAVYSATKGGVIALTRSLARELARHHITVNCVSPGPTDTPMLRAWAADNAGVLDKLVRTVPLRRLGMPDDIASAVTFLASDKASYVTGQVLSVSGGVTMV
jgi:2-hydroxycyclohexanecarboxyl-CoA dehydrogenase